MSALEHDDDGDPLPMPEPKSDLADLIQLMEWARKKGFVVGPMVKLGKIAIQIRDVRQHEGQLRADFPAGDFLSEAGYREE